MPPASADWFPAALNAAGSALDTLGRTPGLAQRMTALAALLARRLDAGNKVLICGNGGSACDAAHFAEELTGRFRKDRPPLAAIACSDAAHITCTANDFGFAHVFSRWVLALARPGDALILLSTSGNSENIARAAATGRELNLHCFAFLGAGGGRARDLCPDHLIVPGDTSDRIQELHMLLLHTLVEGIERTLFPHLYA